MSTSAWSALRRPDDAASVGLLLVSAAIATAVVSPLLWIFWQASQVGLDQAFSLTTMPQTLGIIPRSIALMVMVTVLSVCIGVPLAFLTGRTDLPFRRFWTIVAALPLVIPSYIGAFAFVSAFGPHGEFTEILGVAAPTIAGFWGATLVITLYTYPYVFLTTRAALLSMDASHVDAARTLNATRLEAFYRITLPRIRPAIAAGALLVALYALADFGTPAFMRLEVFTSAIYWEWTFGNVEYTALLAIQLLTVAAVVLAIEARVGQEVEPGGATNGARVALGRLRWVATVALALLAFITLVVPVVIFGIWLTRAGTPGSGVAFQPSFAVNSLYLAGGAALVAVLFAIPVAYYAARDGGILARLFERATYVGFAVPGIVIGIALVYFGSNFAPAIYPTVGLLIFAYVVRFLPQAVGITRSAVLQVDDRYLEAARTLNTTRFGTFRRVTLPLIVPGIVAGGGLVFLTTIKELPATLMLQPAGLETLVTVIWHADRSLNYAQAAVPALILIVLSGLSMLIIIRQERYHVT